MVATLSHQLAAEFEHGFDASNLRDVRLFCQAFPIRDALRHELSWTHYCTSGRGESARCLTLHPQNLRRL
jgi:hypothetical protein